MLICYSSHGKLIDEESHTYSCCGIRCGDAGKVLVTEHGFYKILHKFGILLRPSGPTRWPLSSSIPWPTLPRYTLQTGITNLNCHFWKIISCFLEISLVGKWDTVDPESCERCKCCLKSGKMFLLHMMESKQASLLKIEIHLFHGSEPVWYLAPWGPPTILPSGIHTLVYFPRLHCPVLVCVASNIWQKWWCVTFAFKNTVASLPGVAILLACSLWQSLALGSQPPCPKGTQAVQRRKSTWWRTEFSWWQSLEWAWKRIFSSLSQVWKSLQPPLTVWLYPERPRQNLPMKSFPDVTLRWPETMW